LSYLLFGLDYFFWPPDNPPVLRTAAVVARVAKLFAGIGPPVTRVCAAVMRAAAEGVIGLLPDRGEADFATFRLLINEEGPSILDNKI